MAVAEVSASCPSSNQAAGGEMSAGLRAKRMNMPMPTEKRTMLMAWEIETHPK